MLINLLPGVRELRTPLAVGYSLLLASYLTFFDRLREWILTSGVGRDLKNLAGYAGVGPSLAALTFLAYIIGSLWIEMVSPVVRAMLHKAVLSPYYGIRIKVMVRRAQKSLDEVAIYGNNRLLDPDFMVHEERFRKRLEKIIVDRIRRAYTDVPEFKVAFKERLSPDQVEGIGIAPLPQLVTRVMDIRHHVNDLAEDFRNVPARLLGKEPDVWNSWDRLRSEAEFRTAISTAVFTLSVALAVRVSSWLIVIGLLVSSALWSLGTKKERSANSVLFEAVMANRVDLYELIKLSDPRQVRWLDVGPWSKGIPPRTT